MYCNIALKCSIIPLQIDFGVEKMQELFSYGLISASTVMFGFMFFFNELFRKNYGSGLKATLVMSAGGNIFGLITLLIVNGIVFEFSVYAFIMASIAAINGLLFSFCSLYALSKISLSLYSLFSMLGGMVLPFVSGILFHGEPFTVSKAVCFVIITAALILATDKTKQKGGTLFYIGIFVFNGMAGVIANAYQSLPFKQISSAGFSILKSVVIIAICVVMLLFIKGEKIKFNFGSMLGMAGSGVLGNIGNWLLLIALLNLDSSVQYPFITGGTMIVSTIISAFTSKKPTKKEVVAVTLAFVGILLLVILPEKVIFQFKELF